SSEDTVYRDLVNRFIIPAVETKTPLAETIVELKTKLTAALRDIKANKTAYGPNTERRMLPSVAYQEQHKAFRRTSPRSAWFNRAVRTRRGRSGPGCEDRRQAGMAAATLPLPLARQPITGNPPALVRLVRILHS